MVDVDEHLRREIGRAGLVARKALRIDQRAGALLHGFGRLPAHELGGGRADHRPQRRLRLQRVVEHVAAGEIGEAFDERLVDRFVHVDALDAAAALAGIEEAAVDEILDRVVELRIGAHVGRVLAAELEAGGDEAIGRRALDRVAALDRTRERHEVDAVGRDERLGVRVRNVQHLHHAFGQAGRGEALGEALGDERRLARMLEDHGIAGEDRGHQGVHRRQERVVPRRDHEHDAERLLPDETREALARARLHVGETIRRQRHHRLGALAHALHFRRRVAHRPAHLARELCADLLLPRQHRGDEAAADRDAARERHGAPRALGLTRGGEHNGDRGAARKRTPRDDAAVDRRDDFDFVGHQMISKYLSSSQSLTCFRNSRSSQSRVAA